MHIAHRIVKAKRTPLRVHNARMARDLRSAEAAERLVAARIKRGIGDAKATAAYFGWNYDTYIQHERGERGIRPPVAAKYAKNLRTSAAWLLTGEGLMSSPGVTLVGHVGADSRPDVVIMSAGQGDLAHDIEAPPDRRPGTVAVEVRGDSMRGTAKDGWLVYYNEEDIRLSPFEDLIGELCVCWTADGRVLLKELQPGRFDGHYDLESMNADTIRDVVVERATKVTFIRPKGRRPIADVLTRSGRQIKATAK